LPKLLRNNNVTGHTLQLKRGTLTFAQKVQKRLVPALLLNCSEFPNRANENAAMFSLARSDNYAIRFPGTEDSAGQIEAQFAGAVIAVSAILFQILA